MNANVQNVQFGNTSNAIVNGQLTVPAIKRIVDLVFGALRPQYADLPAKLEAIEFDNYQPLVVDGKVAEGRDTELARVLPRLLRTVYDRRIWVTGVESRREAMARRSGESSDAPDGITERIEDGSMPRNYVNNVAPIFQAMQVFDQGQDGLPTVDTSNYRPSLAETAWDASCILRSMVSLAKHENLSYLVRVIGDEDNRYTAGISFMDYVRERKARNTDILKAVDAAAKADVMYDGPAPANEVVLAGFAAADDEGIDPNSVGAHEAWVTVSELLDKVGFNDHIGEELSESAGRSKAVGLIIALNERKLSKVMSAMQMVGLIRQSAAGVALIHQLTRSPEWMVAKAERDDAKLRHLEEQAARDAQYEDRMLAIERDKLRRQALRQRTELLAIKASKQFEAEMKKLQRETEEMLGIKPKVEKAPARKTRKSR